MKKLPSFEQWFYRKDYETLDHRIRIGENEEHDAIYLSSYLHDARFNLEKMICRRNRLIIPLERDTWELARDVACDGLGYVQGELAIYPVKAMEDCTVTLPLGWLNNPETPYPDLAMVSLKFDRTDAGILLTLQGKLFQIKIHLDPGKASIRYRDSGILFSHRTGKPVDVAK